MVCIHKVLLSENNVKVKVQLLNRKIYAQIEIQIEFKTNKFKLN